MSKITVEGSPVGPDLGLPISVSGHLLLVFTDDTGNEFIIRGGPTPNSLDRGKLILEINVPIALSVDIRSDGETAADRGAIELDLDGRDASDVWKILQQHAAQIHAKGYKYEPTGYNSNGTVGNLLRLIGLDPQNYLPDTLGGMIVEYYNYDKIFQFDFTIIGTGGDDKLKGREQEFSEKSNQSFFGGVGKDTLLGGAGNDGLYGQKDNDTLKGGFGNDRLDGGDGVTVTVH